MINFTRHTVCFLLANVLWFSPAFAEALSEPTGSEYTFSQLKGKVSLEQSRTLTGQSNEKIQYAVYATNFQGIASWKISWHSEQLKAQYYIRRSDNAPLYIKRENHVLQRQVEIIYSLTADKPHVYRCTTGHEFIERNIWNETLIDLGTLPHRLATAVSGQQGKTKDLRFHSINYNDGEVYPILAKLTGFRQVLIKKKKVLCAVYSVNVDSWLANFNRSVKLLIPTKPGYGSFVAYEGPSPTGNGETVSIHHDNRNIYLASR